MSNLWYRVIVMLTLLAQNELNLNFDMLAQPDRVVPEGRRVGHQTEVMF